MAVFSHRLQLINRVIAHSDAGSQYVSVAYTERLAEIGARPAGVTPARVSEILGYPRGKPGRPSLANRVTPSA